MNKARKEVVAIIEARRDRAVRRWTLMVEAFTGNPNYWNIRGIWIADQLRELASLRDTVALCDTLLAEIVPSRPYNKKKR